MNKNKIFVGSDMAGVGGARVYVVGRDGRASAAHVPCAGVVPRARFGCSVVQGRRRTAGH